MDFLLIAQMMTDEYNDSMKVTTEKTTQQSIDIWQQRNR